MRRFLLFCSIGLVSHSLFAFSSNNSCLPVFANAVEEMGTLNENINGTIRTTDKILILANKVVDKSVPEIIDQMASVAAELEAIRKLAEDRTSVGFIVGVSMAGSFTAVVTILVTNISVKWWKRRWHNRHIRADSLPVTTNMLPNIVEALGNAARVLTDLHAAMATTGHAETDI